MTKSWKLLEAHIRELASVIWSRPVVARRISGVNYDAVIEVSDDEIILIEITEQFLLNKVRDDIAKIIAVKLNFASKGILTRGFIVLNQEPTPGMSELGIDSKIMVLSAESFTKMAFDFQSYVNLRSKQVFGSAINPTTGEPDKHAYIPVEYTDELSKHSFTTLQIAEKLLKGEKLILLGEYGTGKSRCAKETFEVLVGKGTLNSSFVFSINLRDHWGASSAIEIIAGHLKRIGMSNVIDRAMQLLTAGHITLILDGFDEVGSQTFGHSLFKREAIRKEALKGIRELIGDCRAGVLVTGRPHYFDSNKEMYDCLGISLRSHQSVLIKCAVEFDEAQAQNYLRNIGIKAPVPKWLPRKPLIFLILAEISNGKAQEILSAEIGEVGFWGQFLDTVCTREARINASIDPETVRNVLTNLAAIVRSSDRALGRLTPTDVNQAYEKATGSIPDESGQLMLSRLCTLGRIEPESPDRQFVDPYIAQLLFVENLFEDVSNKNTSILAEPLWKQGLKKIGIEFLAQYIEHYGELAEVLAMVNHSGVPVNSQPVGELVAAASLLNGDSLDFKGLQIKWAEISLLELGNIELKNIEFKECLFDVISFESSKISSSSRFKIEDSFISMVTGFASETARPEWIVGGKIEETQSASNSARIKSSNLPPSQKLLLSIIQKIFFQRGGGRKESSLYKGGFGEAFDRKIIDQIINILLSDGLIERSKDSSGHIYNPNREYTARMKAIKDQLSLSNDPLWLKMLTLDQKKHDKK
ncbi:NACHT domain-containing protein [Undibacterium sp. Ji42W]|uniref:NACHT domain-containing protein n=1 Tax=Undibacterium sp. Ji42W TaxID=3413039 RepID=UPI003BF0FB22